MRFRILPAGVLGALLASSCVLDPSLLESDGPLVVVADEPPDEDLAWRLETDVLRESDGQVVVRVFNRTDVAVRDVEIEVARVSRKGRRRSETVTIGRRIGPGSMDQTRTSLFVSKRDVKRLETRVTSAARAD